MIGEWLPPVAAGLLSAFLSFIELSAGRRKALSVRAWPWILGRVGIDAATGAVAYGVLNGALQGVDWFDGPVGVILAAAAGPAVLRGRLTLISVGGETKGVGITAHEQLLRRFDDQIDDIGAEAQARWRHETARALSVLSLHEVVRRANAYLANLDRLQETAEEERQWLEATAAEESTPEARRRDAIIQRLLDLGGRRFLSGLARECRNMKPPSGLVKPTPQEPAVPELTRKNHASRP